ncbi:MAG: VWA domain-containing protein [Rhizobiaceae bacterium]|nr:VWA domain-containing protein [Rhizobiaceae bacterium]
MNFTRVIKKFVSEKSGNVAVIFAIAAVPLMMSVGAAIDYSQATNLQNKVSQATDAALLAAAATVMDQVNLNETSLVEARLNQEFEPFFLANMANANSFTYNGYNISYDPDTRNVTVNIDIDYQTGILKIFGMNNWQADVISATSMKMKAGGAISMYLVLDKSGSMSWDNGSGGTKMESLQIAVATMINKFEENDPDEKYIRIGAVSYDIDMQAGLPINWDISNANNYVQAMIANGGTDSSNSVELAYHELMKPSELLAHQSRNYQTPDKIMVFMTDGDNNNPADDVTTQATCNEAKNDGVVIYTVAFQAPPNGQQLLAACATDASHYFEPETTQELIDAFEYIGADSAEKLILSQ